MAVGLDELMIAAGLVVVPHPAVQAQSSLRLWLFAQANLMPNGEVARIDTPVDRAAAAGYTALILSDIKLEMPAALNGYHGQQPLQQVLSHAALKGVAIVPTIYSFGYSHAILGLDQNLAEPQPIAGTPLVVAPDGRTLQVNSTV